MSTQKLSISSTLDAMKPEQNAGKAENDSLDSLIQRAIGKEQGSSEIQNSSLADDAVDEKGHALGYYDRVRSLTSDVNGVKEPFLSTKAKGIPLKGSKSSSEQMQSLKIPEAVVAFAQAAAKANDDPEKYLSSWSLFSSPKVQLQKCEKCSREFCSPINYRRHIRIHRRSPQINKDFPKNRELLASFWDKLSFEATREILSMKDVKLEDIAGSSIIRALVSFMRTAAFSSLPHVYLKAGTGLLDVIQSRDPGSSVSSWELFSILDDASEKTFLSVGAATSLTKFLFDGESGKVALETKNLVACTSFLVEQNLVEAWLADKDAEALRCHKLLLEEEEAAQKRQADLLERRRLKKLKRKGRRNKENIDLDKEDSKEGLPDTVEGASCSAGTSSPRSMAEPGTNTWEAGSDPVEELQPIQYFHDGINTDVAGDVLHSQNMDCGTQQGNIRWQQTGAWQPTSKSVGNMPNGSSSTLHLSNEVGSWEEAWQSQGSEAIPISQWAQGLDKEGQASRSCRHL
ncbi:hypothetical protein QJS10_CPB21g00424 [Acorus calamus]|uniref:C2H2-type domain-containing protein n=1 Tax=Acorus calamus TaxID=4465 RepID=A0AAV9C384_ACOCL|nr:hypothetical protein QJS10_CPB21g00424 [Acorus calamus]